MADSAFPIRWSEIPRGADASATSRPSRKKKLPKIDLAPR